MKIIIKLNLPENSSKEIYLDENVFYIEENDRLEFDCKYEDRFNTLISLFACNKSWVSEDIEDPTYLVTFINKKEVTYSFDKAPSNWGMFMGYITKLVGDSK